MGLLNKKERILDISLTDKGRELLSKNQLDFSFYAFSDDGIDYSGSLSSAVSLSGTSIDDYVFNNVSFEPNIQHNQKGLEQNKDLKYFLYNAPAGSKVSLEFKTSEDDVGDTIVLNKNYSLNHIDVLTNKNFIKKNKNKNVIATANIDRKNQIENNTNFVLTQIIERIKNK